jgi:hypothetical protein
MADKTIFGLSRHDFDKPMIVFLSLVGNDVCNMRTPTEDAMTSPERFKEETLKSLNYLGRAELTYYRPDKLSPFRVFYIFVCEGSSRMKLIQHMLIG